ncbi:Hypothetical protein HVR_LOCUS159 [uncultured virus]|nr:Hypothetical protein HVR_LOCUS159 [uncultured virus]
MLARIWDDINREAEAIVIMDIKYNPGSLTNKLYDIIDNRTKRRQTFKENKIKGLYKDFYLVRAHREVLEKDENITMLIQALFKANEVVSITSTDRLFLNSYYRRLLRAKLERDFIGKEIIKGMVITEYTEHDADLAIAEVLRLLRFICKYLGIESTTSPGSFSLEKLYQPEIWANLTEKFVPLFGEEKIGIIEIDDSPLLNSLQAVIMFEGQKKIRQSQVLMFLNIIFNTWSGSTLVLKDDTVTVVPATYINRLMPKLR